MMKTSGALSAEKSENSDAVKLLYRGASDVVHKLDKVLKNASSIQDCYKSNVVILRTRLREICERLMFLDPIGHGKKAEDLLWRKVHYETISAAKGFRKSPSWSISYQYWVSHHIKLGIGTYHHLLFRLQSEFQLNEGFADFLPLSDSRGCLKEKIIKSTRDDEVTDWALQSYQRCLICMGDLARYHQELCGGKVTHAASRYYHQALLVCPQLSMPHNQLGTLVGSKNYNCDAAYHYMRCAMYNNGFEGARGNLRRIFERNQVFLHECAFHPIEGLNEQQAKELQVKTFIVGFLQYCEVCFKYPNIDPDLPFGQLCQLLVENFQKCLDKTSRGWPHSKSNKENEVPKLPNEILGAANNCCNEESPCHLSDYLILKIFIMSLMCLEKLEKEASACASAATALTLATFSHLLYFILMYFKKTLHGVYDGTHPCTTVPSQETLPSVADELTDQHSQLSLNNSQTNNALTTNLPKEAQKQSPKKGNLRFRRKRHEGLSLEDSDLSEGEASSTSEIDPEEVMGSDASENDETDRSSPCTDEDQGLGDEDDHPHNKTLYSSGKKSLPNDTDVKESIMADEGVNSDTESLKNSPSNDGHGLDNTNLGTSSSSNIDFQQQKTKSGEEGHLKAEIEIKELDPTSVEEMLLVDKLLPIVKICGDWLKYNSQIIIASAQGSQKLWSRYVELLNLLAVFKNRLNSGDVCEAITKKTEAWADMDWKQTWPLPEDIILNGMPLFAGAHKSLRFETLSSVWFTEKEEVLLRISCLQNLGVSLSKYSELGIIYDAQKESFTFTTSHQSNKNCKNNNNNASNIARRKRGKSWTKHSSEGKVQERKKHLMRNMAQLWLEAEVKELESSLHSSGQPKFSPYLIPDSSVLIDNLHIIRQLMTSKVFIFILPIAVLQCLDLMKKESIKAREAIRWLEGEFQKHNRYLRAQKQHERLTLSLLKYPKRKEKDAWNIFLILECANYFARHGSTTNDLSANLVTVLTTENAGSSAATEKNNYNLFPLAGSAGLKVQTIEELHGKWLTASKPRTEGTSNKT